MPSGIIGDMEFGNADICWANLYVVFSRLNVMSFSRWYTLDNHCIMSLKPEPYPKILALVRPFDLYTWIGCAVILLIGTSFFVIFRLTAEVWELSTIFILCNTIINNFKKEVTLGKSVISFGFQYDLLWPYCNLAIYWSYVVTMRTSKHTNFRSIEDFSFFFLYLWRYLARS